MKVSIRKNIVKLDLSQDEEDILFRSGLQIIADKYCKGRKVIVLPPNEAFCNKNTKKVEATKEMIEECLTEAVTEAIKQYVKKYKEENEENKNDQLKGITKKPNSIQRKTKTKGNK